MTAMSSKVKRLILFAAVLLVAALAIFFLRFRSPDHEPGEGRGRLQPLPTPAATSPEPGTSSGGKPVVNLEIPLNETIKELPGQTPRAPWEQLKKRYTRTAEAQPYVARMREQFQDVTSIRIQTMTGYVKDFEGLPQATDMRGTYLITLKPFRVYEKTVLHPQSPWAITGRPTPSPEDHVRHRRYERIRIITPLGQYLKITDLDGNTHTERKTNMAPDPLFLGMLPGIGDVFGSWEWYGASLGTTTGIEKRKQFIGKGPLVDLPFVEIENMIGKTVLCEWPKDAEDARKKGFQGRLLPAEVVTWGGLLDKPRSDQVLGWDTIPFKDRLIALPQDIQTLVQGDDGKWTQVMMTEFTEVEFNVDVDEGLFQFPSQ